MKACTFVTGNPNKVIEVTAILGDTIPIRTLALDLPEIQGSLEEIARDKCRRATQIVDGPVIVEDSALEFYAMNSLPGPYIKYFLEALGNDGLNKLLAPYEDKSADAVCTFAYSSGPDHVPIVFQGRLHGTIVPARGPPVFGVYGIAVCNIWIKG
ncbi:Inosine triphosphate pyrophosphatase [Penicillium oxalicum]|uniref:Inosine triphosphate pyrophosphatase n=1 Tax=Penicillium oxalicum TaxID=69781 RepID=UPI0020B77A88|nr:Inosine triphosphate pyrophosphatase [Penicillium oxalicum]KAI2794926.1 Inosine triphosphate pyrophosphatase [Penicillium oxalicum]